MKKELILGMVLIALVNGQFFNNWIQTGNAGDGGDAWAGDFGNAIAGDGGKSGDIKIKFGIVYFLKYASFFYFFDTILGLKFFHCKCYEDFCQYYFIKSL